MSKQIVLSLAAAAAVIALTGCASSSSSTSPVRPQVSAELEATRGNSVKGTVRFMQTGDNVILATGQISDEELANADKYEVADYKRVAAPLASGRTAWVYVDARA